MTASSCTTRCSTRTSWNGCAGRSRWSRWPRRPRLTTNVRSDNPAGMRDLAGHLVRDHGYRTLSYIGGHIDSPDSIARLAAFSDEVAAAGGTFTGGPQWQGNYTAAAAPGSSTVCGASGGAEKLPRAIVCANDQTALGVVYAPGSTVAGRPRGCGGDRVRRHSGGPPPADPADHGPPAHPGTWCHRLRGALFDDQRRRDPRATSSCPTTLIRRRSCVRRGDPATLPWLVG